MSATWPWVILGRVPRVAPIPSDAEGQEAAFRAPDFSIRVAPPPQVTLLTVGPLAHPDPNEPDKYPYILAAGPDCLLFNFGIGPFSGVNSADGSVLTYLIVVRRFSTGTAGVQQSHAAAPLGESIPLRRDGGIPVSPKIESVGLVASYDGDYTVAELEVDKGAERARLFRFRAGGNVWTRNDLSCPLAAEDREWVPAGVVAQKTRLWWFDLSWGLLSCDCGPFVDDPVLLFHKLPEDRALDKHPRPDSDIHTRRGVTVSQRELRYVEIIPEDGGDCHDKEAATVSMWTRQIADTPAGWDWEWNKKYAVSFEEIWNDDTYKDTGLPRKVPVLSAVCPSNRDLVYFSLEQRLFGVDVPEHKVVEVADEPHGLVDVHSSAPKSCRYAVHAWNLPPCVALDLDLVGFDEDKDQAEEPDEEELVKLGLEVAMGMDPSTLKSEREKFCNYEGPSSPEWEAMMQLRPPFYRPFTDKEVEEDLMRIEDRVMKKRRLGE